MMYVGENKVNLTTEAKLWFHCLLGGFSKDQMTEIKSAYAWGAARRVILYLPDELFRYTQIFISAVVCWTAQLCGLRKAGQDWTYRTNESIIAMALHTVSRSYYVIGWADPRAGLMFNSLARLGHRALSGCNWLEYRVIGYRNDRFPIDLKAFGYVLEAKAMRVYHIMRALFASAILACAELCPKGPSIDRWTNAIRPLTETARDHVSIPLYEIAMTSPNIGQRAVLKVAKIVEWGLRH